MPATSPPFLTAPGWTGSVSVRAAQIVAKQGLGSDPEVQTFEDAVSLTFLETELHSVLDRLGDDTKAADIVAKTLDKMSPAGRDQPWPWPAPSTSAVD